MAKEGFPAAKAAFFASLRTSAVWAGFDKSLASRGLAAPRFYSRATAHIAAMLSVFDKEGLSTTIRYENGLVYFTISRPVICGPRPVIQRTFSLNLLESMNEEVVFDVAKEILSLFSPREQ